MVSAIGASMIQRTQTTLNKAADARQVAAKRAAEARMKGFEGDACGGCGNFTLVRNGTCMKCNTCGSTSGCS
jgi:ribonucleoside-diphosphate reductase alpha chain